MAKRTWECENRWMDEHIRIFSGTTITVEEGNQVDANLNDLTWWTEKHNGYATGNGGYADDGIRTGRQGRSTGQVLGYRGTA
ncbi:MAG: hypothetical protein ACLUVG_01960 [Phocaeicola vulgatus]